MEIKNVAVIGSGTMGRGIAEVFALYGFNVYLEDISDDILKKAINEIKDSLEKLARKGNIGNLNDILSRIRTYTSIESAVKDADLVIEAVPELEELKKKIFSEIEKYTRKDTILASNTSSIRITDIAKDLMNKERVAGLHFFNPPPLMKLVEVVKAEQTSDEVLNALVDIAKKIGKYPVRVMKDTPGFIINRINASGRLLLCLLIDREIASPEEIDAMFIKLHYPMGPFELMDYVGIDVVYDSMEYYTKALHPDFGKCKTIRKLFKNKQLGKKTGRGFYDWSSGRPVIDTKKATDKVSIMDIFAVEINEAVKLIEQGIAIPDDIEKGIQYGLNRPFGPISVAKNINVLDIKSRLIEISNRWDCKMFEPANSIKIGSYPF